MRARPLTDQMPRVVRSPQLALRQHRVRVAHPQARRLCGVGALFAFRTQHTTERTLSSTSLFAQVRRDDVLAIQTALGGPNAATFHEACRAAFTQSVDNLTRSDPGGTPLRTDQTVTQPGIDTTSNDIAYGQYTFND